MPHDPIIPQAKKRARQSERRRLRNKGAKVQLKGALKAFTKSVETGASDTEQLYRTAASEVDKAVHKHIVHKNAANRKKSRMAKRMNKQAQA